MRISDWSSDVCSSDLRRRLGLSRSRIRCHGEGIGAIPVPGVRQGGQASFLESRYHGIPAPKPCERVGQPKQRLRMERGQFSCQFREHIVDRILSLGFVAVAQLDLEAADKIGTTIGVIALEALLYIADLASQFGHPTAHPPIDRKSTRLNSSN